ncbi:hypothetical protein [Pediococcus pentosaceus]|uniref:hypothetical protein n=1 Tax=Pediococcus pentosaceus TaxID=1255 RepID=UPI001330AF8D|nr:hypothetical protein [Pediococcus pentosaceus]KAF0504565.1 hypothetical protein GBP24_09365 [Pediococcus pentosaceus]
MLKKAVNQGLIVLGIVFILAMIINSITPVEMFSGSAQISYVAFFIVYVGFMYMKNSKNSKS